MTVPPRWLSALARWRWAGVLVLGLLAGAGLSVITPSQRFARLEAQDAAFLDSLKVFRHEHVRDSRILEGMGKLTCQKTPVHDLELAGMPCDELLRGGL